MGFSLQFDKLKYISWRVWVFKLVTRDLFMQTMFDLNCFQVFQWCGFQKLKYPFCKTNNNQFTLSHIDPTFLNKSPNICKHTNNLHTFQNKIKKYFFKPNLKIQITLFEFIFIFNFHHPDFYPETLILNNRIQFGGQTRM